MPKTQTHKRLTHHRTGIHLNWQSFTYAYTGCLYKSQDAESLIMLIQEKIVLLFPFLIKQALLNPKTDVF